MRLSCSFSKHDNGSRNDDLWLGESVALETISMGEICRWFVSGHEKVQDCYFNKHIDSLHEKLKFATEIENDGKLAFLDTEIQWNSNKSLSVPVYRKPSHTDRYLNANSHH